MGSAHPWGAWCPRIAGAAMTLADAGYVALGHPKAGGISFESVRAMERARGVPHPGKLGGVNVRVRRARKIGNTSLEQSRS